MAESDRSECPVCHWPTRGVTPEEQTALDAFHAELHIALDLEAQAKVHRDKANESLLAGMDAYHAWKARQGALICEAKR